jgi:phosphoribosyl-ATP pyrophosphohydrolase
MAVYDDGLDEYDPTPPEYDLFKEWFYQVYPGGNQMMFQDLNRAYQAGHHRRGAELAAQPAGLTAMLRQGHAQFGASAPTVPTTDVDPAYAERRREMLREEVGEFEEALAAGDLEQIAKEGADVIYVAAGTLTTHGIDPDAAVAAVHDSNMTKEPAGNAKAIKGPGYRSPDMAAVLWPGGQPGSSEVTGLEAG